MGVPRVVWVAVAWSLGNLLAACGRDALTPAPLAHLSAPVVYGDDDRTEWFAVTDEATRELMRSAIAAMVFNQDVVAHEDGSFEITSRETLGQANGMCADQRFFDEPTPAICSGTLIDDRLLLTAGHCIQSLADCAGYTWVFDYRYEADGKLAPLGADAIYHCVDLVTNGFDDVGADYDFAVIELDRPVTGRVPARVRPPGPVDPSGALALIGFPNGIPMKFANHGVVVDARADDDTYFVGAVDAFYGNSGSGVFDDQMAVAGILVTGADDYVDVGSCAIVQVLDPADGEEKMTYASRAVAELCAKRYPSEALCGTTSTPTCGDGWCTGDEVAERCPSDCDGLFAVPAAWTCNPGFYAASDGCDCDCGAFDPDCVDPKAEVYDCAPNSRCGTDGACEFPIPEAWTCPREYYATNDGCDCACGVYDPDCDTSTHIAGCVRGTACLPDGTCASPIAPTWTCPDRWYAAHDGCDCDCGAIDPDCADPGQDVSGCAPGSACQSDGTCEQSIPGGWICPAQTYGSGGACDCNCGARDPDCDAPQAPTVNCIENQVCGAAGECIARAVEPETEPTPEADSEPPVESADELGSTDEPAAETDETTDAHDTSNPETDAADASSHPDADGASEPVRAYASGNGCASGRESLGGLLAAITGCAWAARRRVRRSGPDGRLPARVCAITRERSCRPSRDPTKLALTHRGPAVAQTGKRPRPCDRRRRKLNAHANVTSF